MGSSPCGGLGSRHSSAGAAPGVGTPSRRAAGSPPPPSPPQSRAHQPHTAQERPEFLVHPSWLSVSPWEILLVCRFSGIGERMKVYTQAKCTLWKPESVRCISKFGKLKTKTKTKQTAKRLRNIRGCFAKLSTWIMTILFSRIPGWGLSLPARLRDEETEAHRGQVHAANEWQSWD